MNDVSGQVSILINVPVSKVYTYLLDFTRHPEWVKNLRRVRQESSGPIEVGTTFQCQEGPPPVALRQRVPMMFHFMSGVLSGAKTFSRAEITALEPNRRIAWQAGVPKGEGYFNLAQWEFILEAQGQATCLTQRFVYQPQNNRSRRMIGVAGAKGLEQACALSLEQLKKHFERDSH
ncbi:MAG TPA: SRPBCC family protein [Anaerolineae bacterium]|nr:SRPBCC family protein [Anaerolineae bacterium]